MIIIVKERNLFENEADRTFLQETSLQSGVESIIMVNTNNSASGS